MRHAPGVALSYMVWQCIALTPSFAYRSYATAERKVSRNETLQHGTLSGIVELQIHDSFSAFYRLCFRHRELFWKPAYISI